MAPRKARPGTAKAARWPARAKLGAFTTPHDVDWRCAAAVLDLKQSQFHELVRAGILPRVAAGRYDLAALVKAHEAYVNADKDTPAIAVIKRRYWHAKADREQDAVRIQRGEYVRMDAVRTAMLDATQALVAQLEGLPGRMAAELAGISDAGVVRVKLIEEIRRVRAGAAEGVRSLEALQPLGTRSTGACPPMSIGRFTAV